MRDTLRKKDFTIMSYTQKDMTLQIMNIKVEEINAFFLQLLKKLTIQHEKEKQVYKRQFANVGETIKDSIINDPNLAGLLKHNYPDKSNSFLTPANKTLQTLNPVSQPAHITRGYTINTIDSKANNILPASRRLARQPTIESRAAK